MEEIQSWKVEESGQTYDLEDRLIRFSVLALNMVEQMPDHYASVHLGKQLTRSCTSAALNYGEAQGAESRQDFMHKIRLVLKEIRESRVNLKIIHQKPYLPQHLIQPVLQECNELMAIFIRSIKTAKEKQDRKSS